MTPPSDLPEEPATPPDEFPRNLNREERAEFDAMAWKDAVPLEISGEETPPLSPEPATNDNRFANWATDLLSRELREFAGAINPNSGMRLVLLAAADRLDALYYGEANNYHPPASSPSSAGPRTETT